MSLNGKARKGVLWSLAQQASIQGINLLVQLFLMRLLTPSDFGIIALITVFISLGNVIVEGGLTSSLIRSKELDIEDYSSVFLLNLFLSLFLYFLIFVSAPFISIFYGEPSLKAIIRTFGVVLIIKALAAIQVTKFTRDLNFKIQFIINLPSVIVGGVVGLLSALNGFGVWSLVFMALCQSLVSMILSWQVSDLAIKWSFNFEKIKGHFSFGYKLALSSSL